MPHGTQHLATCRLDHGCGIALQRVAEGVVGCQEEPGVATGLDHRTAGAVGPRPGVVCPESAEHTSALQSLMRISYAVFFLTNQNLYAHHYSISLALAGDPSHEPVTVSPPL